MSRPGGRDRPKAQGSLLLLLLLLLLPKPGRQVAAPVQQGAVEDPDEKIGLPFYRESVIFFVFALSTVSSSLLSTLCAGIRYSRLKRIGRAVGLRCRHCPRLWRQGARNRPMPSQRVLHRHKKVFVAMKGFSPRVTLPLRRFVLV